MDSPSDDLRAQADQMTYELDVDLLQRQYIQSLQDIATLAREDLHNVWELHERKNCKVHNKFDRELADRKLTVSLQQLDDESTKRLLLVAQLKNEGNEDTIATLRTELQLVSDELQRVYNAHQATLQQLAEEHIKLTQAQQALDDAATQANGQQAQLAGTLRDAQADAASLQNRCEELSTQLEQAVQQQEATAHAMSALQVQHDNTLQQLQSAKAAHKAQAQQHASIVQDLEERLHAARTEATRNQQRADLATNDVQELQKLLQQRSTMVEDVVASQTRAIMDANQQRVEMLTEELKRLQQQLQSEWQRNGRLEQELSQARLRPLGPTRAPTARPIAAARDVAQALHAVESCIVATADSGGQSPDAGPVHQPLLPPVEPTMSSPGMGRLSTRNTAAFEHNPTASANASTPLPRDVAAAEALVHRAAQLNNAAGEPSDMQPSDLHPVALPQHSVDPSGDPSEEPRRAAKARAARAPTRGGKRKAATVLEEEEEGDDEEELPAARGRGRAAGRGSAKQATKRRTKATRAGVPREEATAKRDGRLPVVEEEEAIMEEAEALEDMENEQQAPAEIVPPSPAVKARTTTLPVVGRNRGTALNSITARVGNAAANMQRGTVGAMRKTTAKANNTTLSGHSTTVMPQNMILGGGFTVPKLASKPR